MQTTFHDLAFLTKKGFDNPAIVRWGAGSPLRQCRECWFFQHGMCMKRMAPHRGDYQSCSYFQER